MAVHSRQWNDELGASLPGRGRDVRKLIMKPESSSPFPGHSKGLLAFATPQPQKGSGMDILVYDLDKGIPVEDLSEGLRGLFSVFGLVTNIKTLSTRKDSSQAIVSFAKRESAEAAMAKINGFSVWGRPLRLVYAHDSDGVEGVGRPATAPQPRMGHAPSQEEMSEIRRDMRREFGLRSPAAAPSAELRSPQARGQGVDTTKAQGRAEQREVPQVDEDEDESAASEGDYDFVGAQNLLQELQTMVRERDEQLTRMQTAERALRELERQRDYLRLELERVGDDGYGLSDISYSAISEADGEASGFDNGSVPLEIETPVFARDSSMESSRPVRGARIVDTSGPPSAEMHAVRVEERKDRNQAGASNREVDELDGLQLSELAEMLGSDSAISAKIMQLDQMLKVAQYMRELDGLMSALSDNQGGGNHNGVVAAEALELATKRLKEIEETLAQIPEGLLRDEGGKDEDDSEVDQEHDSYHKEGNTEDDSEQEQVSGVRYAKEDEDEDEDASGVETSDGDEDSCHIGERMRDGGGSSGEGMDGITGHLQQELDELCVLQERIKFLKGLLKETREQQRLLETESSAGATQDDGEVVSSGDESDDEAVGVGESDYMGEEEDFVGKLERPPSSQNRSSTPQQGWQRSTSRLSWADEEGGRRYLADDDDAVMPPHAVVAPSSRMSSLVESASPCSEGSDDLGNMLLAGTAQLQDLKMAHRFCKRLGSSGEKTRFLHNFLRFCQDRDGPMLPLEHTSTDRAAISPKSSPQTATPNRQAVPSGGGVDSLHASKHADTLVDVSPALLLRELQGVKSQAALRQVLAHIRAVKGHGAQVPGSVGAEGRMPSGASEGGDTPKKRPSSSAITGTPQRLPRDRDSAPGSSIKQSPHVDAGSSIKQSPHVDAGSSIKQSPHVDAGSSLKQSPHVARYNYFVRHLEDEAESPNKLPDDKRPAFDESDDAKLAINLDESQIGMGSEGIGTPFDYAESVSSSHTGGSSVASSNKRSTVWSNVATGTLSDDSSAPDFPEKPQGSAKMPLSEHQLLQLESSTTSEQVARELRRAMSAMVYGRKDGKGGASVVAPEDIRVLSRLTERLLEERGWTLDQHVSSALVRVLGRFVGRVTSECAEEVARQVSSIIFREELHSKVLAQVTRCYDLEVAELGAHQSRRTVDHLMEQLKALRDKDLGRLEEQRLRSLKSDLLHDEKTFQAPRGDTAYTADSRGDPTPDLEEEDISRIERAGSGYQFLEIKIEDLPEERMRFEKDGIRVSKQVQLEMDARARQEQADFDATVSGFKGKQADMKELVSPNSFPVHLDAKGKLTREQRMRLAELGVLNHHDGDDDEMPSTVSYEGSSVLSEDDFELEVGDVKDGEEEECA